MKNVFDCVSKTVTALQRAFKPVVFAIACALLIFSTASPALAFGNSSSDAGKGLEQMDTVQKKSENAAASGAKAGANSARSVSKDASQGLNGVQGSAGKEKMKSPEGANGTTVEADVKEALENIKP